MNFYGFWQYTKEEPLRNEPKLIKGDLIRVVSKCRNKLIAVSHGNIREFDLGLFTNKKKVFIRPIRDHKPSSCKKSLASGEICERCKIYKKKREVD